MHESFLKDIALVLGVAALTSAVVKRFKLPTVLGYMVAGLIIGPYIPIPLFAETSRVEGLSEFGVILVMFAVGLEFRFKRFFKVLPTSGVTALIEMGMMFLLGLSVGYLFDWSTTKSIFLGGALSISSTMIVSKVFEETRADKDVKEHVFGILIIQDIVAILLLTVLGTVAASSNFHIEELAPSVTKLVAVLFFSTVAGLFVIPKFVRYISKQGNYEVLTIVSTGICFATALAVESMGYSVALGAFLAGILISESGEGHKVERLSRPLKDVFSAIFFVSVGMTVNPVVAFEYLPESLLLTVLIVLIQFHTVFIGGVLSGAGTKKALLSSLALGQIGEFAFIISTIGLSAGVVGADFQAIIVTVAVLTSLCTPILWKNSEKITKFVSDHMPNKLRIVIGLYEAWLDRINATAEQENTLFGVPKKIVAAMLLDAVLLIFLPPMILRFLPDILESLITDELLILKRVPVLLITILVLLPIFYGFVRSCSKFTKILVSKVFSESSQTNDKEAFKKLFSWTVFSLLFFILGLSMLTSLRPFMSTTTFAITLSLMLVVTLGRIWIQASEVTEDFESGGQRLVSVLKRQTFKPMPKQKKLEVPGLENIETVKVKNKYYFEKNLAEINLRNATGVTVVSISRGGEKIHFPNHDEKLFKDDVLHVWGSDEAKSLCKKMLS